MIALTVVCLALIALFAWREHTHKQQLHELLTLRLEKPDLTPVVVGPGEDVEPQGYSEEEEVLAVVRGEPLVDVT